MATVTSTPAPVSAPAQASVEPAKGDQRVEFIGIGWEGYEALLKIQGEKSRPQIIYLNGDAYLVSPSNLHERLADRLGTFVRVIVEELDIPCEPTRETTFHRSDMEVGVQPDDSFYLANYRPIAAKDGKEDIFLDVDPPPDLVIEVVHTHPATQAVEVLRRLRVPEVWVCKKDGLSFLIRKKNGRYVEAERSMSFPFLTATEVFDWVDRPGMASMTQRIKEVRRWVQETLVPRVRERGQ
jgi:Uma2 family endonuclease